MAGTTLLFTGCWISDNARHIELGDVSIVQQMMDLRRALDEGAVTADEYAELKEALMTLQFMCEDEDGNDDV